MNIGNGLLLKYVLSILPVGSRYGIVYDVLYNKCTLVEVAWKVNSGSIKNPTNLAMPRIRLITHIVKHISATNQLRY